MRIMRIEQTFLLATCLNERQRPTGGQVGLEGILLDGERYDIGGEPHTYLATMNAFAAPSSA